MSDPDATQKRPDVYKGEEAWNFRASSIGGCIRGLVASRLGIAPQPPRNFLQKALQDSSLAEELVKVQLVKRGWRVEPGGPVTLGLQHGVITGTTDGSISGEGLSRCVLEVKSLGRTLFERYVRGGIENLGRPFTQMYGMQISAYMLATGLPCMVAVYSKEGGMTLEKLYETPPYSMEELDERIVSILDYAAREEYPECDAACSSTSWYWHIHDEKKLVRVSDDELEEKVARLVRLRDTLKTLQDEEKTLADELKAELGSGPNELGPYMVNVSRSFSTRTDLDKLRRDFGEEFLAPYAYEQQTVRLTIRQRKGGQGAA